MDLATMKTPTCDKESYRIFATIHCAACQSTARGRNTASDARPRTGRGTRGWPVAAAADARATAGECRAPRDPSGMSRVRRAATARTARDLEMRLRLPVHDVVKFPRRSKNNIR